MPAPPIVALADRIYIDKRLIKKRKILDRYRVEMYDDKTCSTCNNLPNRPNDLCEQCPAFQGLYNLHRSMTSQYGQRYWTLPIGDFQYVRDEFLPSIKTNIDIRKGTKEIPFDNKIEWIGRLYTSDDKDEEGNPRPNQTELVEKWLVHKNGLIKARPRSGKTVVAVNIACRIGMKTLIIADRIDLLRQFRWTFIGNKRQQRPAMTTARKIEKKKGYGTVVKIIRSMRDLEKYPDVALMTIQTFFSDMDRIKKYVNGKYSLLIGDEIHGFSADASSKVLAGLDMPFRCGLSATTERKDGREILTERTMGPVVAVSKAHTLVPRIKAIKVKHHSTTDYKSWNGCLKFATYSKERNVQIIKQLFRDLKDGHKCIIVPVFWKDHLNALVDAINDHVKWLRKHKKIKYPLDLAVPFHSGVNRVRTLQRADNGDPCILVAINSMVKQGIDLKMPTMLHLIIPASAREEVGAPMFRQLSYRTSTPVPGKRQPEVTLWVDESLSLFKGCLNGLFWKEIVPGLKKKNLLYRIDNDTYNYLSTLKTNRRRRPASGSSWI